MDFDKYFPGTPICDIDIKEDYLYIHTLFSKENTRNIHDLPIFDYKVIVTVSSDATYPWMDDNGNSKRLNAFIRQCCQTIRDEHGMENVLDMHGIRLTPYEYEAQKASGQPAESIPADVSALRPVGRGRKARLDYDLLKKTVGQLQTSAVPATDTEDLDIFDGGYHDFFDNPLPPSKMTLRDIQKQVRKYADFQNISLSTIHKILQTDLKERKPSKDFFFSPDNSKSFGQMYFDMFVRDYDTWMEEYKTIAFEPQRLDMDKTMPSEILTDIRRRENYAFTIPAKAFREGYLKWKSCLGWSTRLYPCIIIKGQTVSFSYAAYRTQYSAFSVSDKYTFPLLKDTAIQPDIERIYFLYIGKQDILRERYMERGAFLDLDIPEKGMVGLGIGDCVRLSMPEGDYLIPLLRIKKYIL